MYMRVYYGGSWGEWTEIPVILEDYYIGDWHITIWSSGRVEMYLTYDVLNENCATALGSWYRTAVMDLGSWPRSIEKPEVSVNYESDGYGALVWITQAATDTKAPSCYLIRPTSGNIVSGKITIKVVGKAK